MSGQDTQFAPKPNETIMLFGEQFLVQPHPMIPHMVYASEGRRAKVYQLRNGKGEEFALKVFKRRYRDSSLILSSKRLERVKNFEGMRAATRRIIAPTDPVVQTWRDFEYAVLMPWLHGKTWSDILLAAQSKIFHLDEPTSFRLCAQFLRVTGCLENHGMAHSDISPANVMLNIATAEVQLLDLEDLYFSGIESPLQQNAGTAGYRHCSGDHGKTFWCPEGDRYAAAILAAEMLILANHKLASRATDEGFFGGHSQTDYGRASFKQAKGWLKRIAPEFAKVFEHSWSAETLEECPRISELLTAIESDGSRNSILHRKTESSDMPSLDSTLNGEETILSPLGQVRKSPNGPVTWEPLAKDGVRWEKTGESTPQAAEPLQQIATPQRPRRVIKFAKSLAYFSFKLIIFFIKLILAFLLFILLAILFIQLFSISAHSEFAAYLKFNSRVEFYQTKFQSNQRIQTEQKNKGLAGFSFGEQNFRELSCLKLPDGPYFLLLYPSRGPPLPGYLSLLETRQEKP